MSNKQKSAKVLEGLRRLSERSNGREHTVEEIAKACDCTPRAIRLIEAAALAKLKRRVEPILQENSR